MPAVEGPLSQRPGDDYRLAHAEARIKGPVSAPRVIVSGMIAATPGQGGASWAVLQYLLGLRRLGCDVLFVEPVARGDGVPDDVAGYCERGHGALRARGALGAAPRGRRAGRGCSRERLLRGRRATPTCCSTCRGCSPTRTCSSASPCAPTSTSTRSSPSSGTRATGVDMRFDAHTHFVTVSDSIGSPGGPIPGCGRDWIPDPAAGGARGVAGRGRDRAAAPLTTVGHWRSYGSIHHDGVHYGQKAHSLRSADRPAAAGPGAARAGARDPPRRAGDLAALEANGWELARPGRGRRRRPTPTAASCRARGRSSGSPSPATSSADSGWFSDRSACYLASGRPVIAQDTGLRPPAPGRRGAARVLGRRRRGRRRSRRWTPTTPAHRSAARELAEEHLDSDRVLGSLLERLLP